MIKNFVLDTNVLLHDAHAIFGFADNNVCLPIYVIEEIDNFKRDLTELGRNAREVARKLDELRKEGNLRDGVRLENNGHLRVIFAEQTSSNGGGKGKAPDGKTMDNKILQAALELAAHDPLTPCVLITKDINLRIRADARGLAAEDYDREQIDISEVYTGFRQVEVQDSVLATFFESHQVVLEGIELYANEYVILTTPTGGQPAYGRFDAAKGALVPVLDSRRKRIFGIRAKNPEQMFALDALMNDDLKLVTLVGKAGTGKTLLALAAGLAKVNDDGVYTKLLVSRPVIPLGRDIGFLPGDIEEKMQPWMKPVYDNLEFLLSLNPYAGDSKKGGQDELPMDGVVEVEPLTYLRGRSIPNQYIVIDESQNLTPHEVKTIITRAGEGTKIVLTGDPYQIDNPYLDSVNNGLTTLVQKFRGQPISGTVTLMTGERSPLAEVASNLL
jgi:PhoH-like ATPase